MVRGRVKSPLQLPNFRRLWIGLSLLSSAEKVWLIALTWLILQETDSGLTLGLILMAGTIPSALFILVGGAISDRFPPYRVAAIAAVVDTCLAGIMVVILLLDAFSIPILVAIAIVEGIADAFLYPSILATFPRVVKKSQLEQANVLAEGSDQLTDIVGPALAGLSVATLGIPITFAVGTLLSALGSVFLGCIHPRRRHRPLGSPQAQNLVSDIVEGLHYVWHHPDLRTILLIAAMLNFAAAGPLIIGCAGLVRLRFGGEVGILGYFQAAAGLGALMGMLIASQLQSLRNPTSALILLAYGLGGGLLTLGVINQVWLAYGVLALMGLGGALVEIMSLAWFQRQTVAQMRGRVIGLFIFADVALEPFSQAVSGFLSDISLTLLFTAAGMTLLVTGIVAGFSQMVRNP